MKYFVSEEVFAALPHYMVGVVAATRHHAATGKPSGRETVC